MAKRRNKTKAKRRYAGLERKVKINGEIVEKMMKMETKASQEPVPVTTEVGDLGEKVQVTESGISDSVTESGISDSGGPDSVTENNKQNQNTAEIVVKKMSAQRGRKPNKKKLKKKQISECKIRKTYGDMPSEEVLIHPKEIDGETCIEINCGNNDAHMYLSKLVLGSKGACIYHSGSWLTPNEFQSVSGRETAKDWKRSIRHKGRSLKMLISKGLISIQSACPKKMKDETSPKDAKKTIKQTSAVKHEIKTTASKHEIKTTRAAVATTTTATKDETKPVGGGTETVSVPQTDKPQAPKKRGRKPKRQRRNFTAMKGAKKVVPETADDTKPPLVTETQTTKKADEIKQEKQEPECSVNQSSPSEEDSEPVPVKDPQAEEERRLAEFVKSLRLTKTVAPVKSAPELSDVDVIKDTPVGAIDEDPEMPVLQKEEDIVPERPGVQENDHMNISVSVDTFHATVTPPPTPPGDEIVIERKTDDEKLGETFRSRLLSPSSGIKLTINRDKVNIADNEKLNSDMKPSHDVNTDNKNTEPNIQTLLLQDALQSAKKYKEQLKQNMQTSPSKPVIRIPDVKSKTDDFKTIEKSLPTTMLPPVSHTISDNHRQQLVGKQEDKSIPTYHDKFDRRHMSQTKQSSPAGGASNGVPTIESMKSSPETSFQELLANMSSVYGPPPFPVETPDGAFTALQEMYRRQETLRMLTQGQADGASSAMLYPMMTQQLLLAMTQQLYSMYNMSGWLPQTKATSSNPRSQMPEIHHRHSAKTQNINHRQPSRTPDINHRQPSRIPDINHRQPSITPEINYRQSSRTPELNYRHLSRIPEINQRQSPRTPEIIHRHPSRTPEIPKLHSPKVAETHRRLSQTPDFRQSQASTNSLEIPLRRTVQPDGSFGQRQELTKRKYSELVSDGAIDLSVKRNRTEHVNAESTNSKQSTDSCNFSAYDIPLDFSMKKANYMEDRHNKSVEKGRLNSTLNMLGKQLPSYQVPESRLKVCTCSRTKDDDIATWSVERVCHFLKDLDGCAQYAKTFHEQGISGRLLPYLTSQHLTRTLGMKVGPALTLIQAVERRFRERRTSSSASRPQCQIHQHFTMPVHIS